MHPSATTRPRYRVCVAKSALNSSYGAGVDVSVFCPCEMIQGLREEIDSMLSKVHEIRFEPRLLSEEDDRLRPESQISQSPHSAHQLPPELCKSAA